LLEIWLGNEWMDGLKIKKIFFSAIVDEPKRFSIDAPPGIGTKVECNVIVVGGFFLFNLNLF